MSKMRLTGAQIVWECLEREGVNTVFGYPGGAILPVYDALRTAHIHHVLVRHEQGAAHMADGYARATGKVGVAMATSGPGATNMVTGIATAMLDSIADRLHHRPGRQQAHRHRRLSGDRHHRHHPADHQAQLFGHATRTTLRATVREAFHIARSGRPGPVLVDITKDAQQGVVRFRLGSCREHLGCRTHARHCGANADPTNAAAGADQQGKAAGDSRRARHHACRARCRRLQSLAERAQHPGGHDAAGTRRASRTLIR